MIIATIRIYVVTNALKGNLDFSLSLLKNFGACFHHLKENNILLVV